MAKKYRLLFITQNIAPFRVQWLEQLSLFFDIIVFNLGLYDSSLNKAYLNYTPKNIEIHCEIINFCCFKFFKISKIMKTNYDILILDGYGSIAQILLIIYLRIKKIPFIMSVDGGIIKDNENYIKMKIKKFCMNSPVAYFSTSNITDNFLKHYISKQIKIYRHYFSSIYSYDICLENSYEKEERKKKLNLDNKFIVLSVGRFIPIKGFDILLKTAAMFNEQVCFIFVGGKPTKDYIEIASNIKFCKVIFYDFLTKEQLKKFYLASDVFVTATRSDVWGLVIGEAMAYGLPIISSKNCIAGLSMINNYENGFIIDDELPKSYFDKICTLKKNPRLRQRMALNNNKLIKHYAIDIASTNDAKNLFMFLNQKKFRIK